MLLKLWVWSRVEGKDHFSKGRKEASFNSNLLAMSDSPSDKTAENVALAYVAWSHTSLVTKDEDAGPYVVADDSDGDVILLTLTILLAAKAFDGLDDRLEHFCVVDALLSLENGNGPFDAHSSVDALSLHFMVGAVCFLSVSHEHVVPDFEILSAVAAWLTVWTACRATCIDEHFAVWTARACLASWSPPVIFAGHEVDSFLWNSKALPLCCGYRITWNFIVSFKDSYAQLVHRNLKDLGHKLEGVLDHLFLEVVSKGPVAKHFKEGKVVWVPYTVDISSSDALLIVTKSLSAWMVCSQ